MNNEYLELSISINIEILLKEEYIKPSQDGNKIKYALLKHTLRKFFVPFLLHEIQNYISVNPVVFFM